MKKAFQVGDRYDELMIILVHVRCGGLFYSINREEAKRLQRAVSLARQNPVAPIS